MTYSDWDIYCAFRKAQANFLSRPYRLPKNWEKYKEEILVKKSRDNIELITKKFNSTWFKIDPERYFDSGFRILGGKFTYNRFFNDKVMKKYIHDDRMIKRSMNLNKRSMIESAKFVKKYMSSKTINPKLSLIRQYTVLSEGFVSLPIAHYIKGNIDKYFLVWLIRRGLVKVSDEEREFHIPEITENYREYVALLNNPKMSDFLDKLRKII